MKLHKNNKVTANKTTEDKRNNKKIKQIMNVIS